MKRIDVFGWENIRKLVMPLLYRVIMDYILKRLKKYIVFMFSKSLTLLKRIENKD